jgi:hypothetical protein
MVQRLMAISYPVRQTSVWRTGANFSFAPMAVVQGISVDHLKRKSLSVAVILQMFGKHAANIFPQ